MDVSLAVRAAPSWAAPLAWGAGLVQIALGAGALTGTKGGALPLAVGTVLIASGAAGFAWGAATLARGRLVVPRAGAAGALLGLVALGLGFISDPGGMSIIAVAAASLLLVAAGAACATAARRNRNAAGPSRMLLLVGSAVVVAALVTPALSSAEAVRLAGDGRPATVVQHGH